MNERERNLQGVKHVTRHAALDDASVRGANQTTALKFETTAHCRLPLATLAAAARRTTCD